MMRRQSQCAGYTLIETLVALSIFAMVSALMAPSFVAHVRHNHNSAIRAGAVAAAQQVLEEIRSQNPETLPNSGTAPDVSIAIGERTYQTRLAYCTRNEFCSARSRHLSLEISWRNEVIYEVETIYTRLR